MERKAQANLGIKSTLNKFFIKNILGWLLQLLDDVGGFSEPFNEPFNDSFNEKFIEAFIATFIVVARLAFHLEARTALLAPRRADG